MARGRIPGWAALAATLVLLAMGAMPASAQAPRHPTGGVPTPAAQLKTIPAAPAFRDFLPQAVDLSEYMPPVGDQGEQGSCVAWATAYAARAYYAEQVEHRDITLKQNQPSPGYLFGVIHAGDDCDQGAIIPDAMDTLVEGAYSLADYPYDDSKCPRPKPAQRGKAKDFRIAGYENVYYMGYDEDLDRVKGALAQGQPVVIMANLDDPFFDLTPKNQIWKSDESSPSVGNHAITLVGYDDRSQTFKFINSWSPQWGDKGYGRMTYDTFHARVYEGEVIKMPGDPDIVLSDTALNPDPIPEPPKPSFVPPLNVRPNAQTRDVAGLTQNAVIDVGNLACGEVDISTNEDGGLVATGFVGTQAELDRVGAALQGKVDDNQVELAQWPACEVRLTLAGALSDSDTPQAAIDPAAPKVGDDVRVGIESPGFASYVYAAYFGADGSVAMLSQPDASTLRAKAGHTQLTFGGPDVGKAGLAIAKPVGDEMLLVVASEKPLFDAALPTSQSDRAFLSDLRTAVLSGEAGRVTATLLPVTTSE